MEVAQGDIGKEAKYKVEFKEGKLVASVDGDFKDLEANLVLKLKAAAVLDALAEAIPGHFEDGAIAAAKVLLGA